MNNDVSGISPFMRDFFKARRELKNAGCKKPTTADITAAMKKLNTNTTQPSDNTGVQDKNKIQNRDKITVEKKYVDKNDTAFTVGKDSNGNTVIRRDCRNDDGQTGLFDTEEVRSPDGKLVSVTTRSYSDINKMGDYENSFAKYVFDKDGQISHVIHTITDKNGNIKESKKMSLDEYGHYDDGFIYDVERGKYQGKEHILPSVDPDPVYYRMSED